MVGDHLMEADQTRMFEVAPSLVAELPVDAAGELVVHTGQTVSVAEAVTEHTGLVEVARQKRMSLAGVVLQMVALLELPAASQALGGICSAEAQMRGVHYKAKDPELPVAA